MSVESMTALKDIEIFAELNEHEIGLLKNAMMEVPLNAGEILFKEGDCGKEMYIVLQGSVSVSVTLPDGQSLEIAVIGRGNFFGEMSIFENVPRSATCMAKEVTRLFKLSGDILFDLIENQPVIANKIMERMLTIVCSRLENTGAFLSDMVLWGEKARKRAITDDFTGLYNRRFLDDVLEDHFKEARRKGKPLSLVMVDLDHFGTLNKLYGEALGDSILLSSVSVFQKVFRKNDILSRYGGDEFTFILKDTPADKAYKYCTRAVNEIRKLDMLADKEGPMKQTTASMGIASFPDHAEDLETLKEKTDKALYVAKEKGRNQAFVFEE